MRKPVLLLFLLLLMLASASAQVLQDYGQQAGLRHFSVDSLRISAGVVAFDYDNDGLDDLYLTGGERPHQLYRNEGGFSFERVTEAAGLSGITATTCAGNAADLDNDGDDDLLITTGEGAYSILLRNNGDGTFTDVSAESGIQVNRYWGMAITFADFNADGFLDFYIGNYARNPEVPLLGSSVTGAYPDELFMSKGQAFMYEEVAAEKGVAADGFTLSARAADFDQDFDMDIYVVNDFGQGGNQVNQFYENDGNGNFTETGAAKGLDLGIFGMGAGLGDYDADGDFDLYVSDLAQNHFLQQQPNGTFANVTAATLATGSYVSWGAEFFDSNNNSQLDLFVPNGAVLGEVAQPLQYYRYLDGQYLETRFNLLAPPLFARGMALSDLDADGDQDVVVVAVAEYDTLSTVPFVQVFRNISNLRFSENGYLQVRLQAQHHNRNGYGTVLKLHLSNGKSLQRMVDNGGAFASRHSGVVHFGLGENAIDSLEVFWPDGHRQVFFSVPGNALVQVNETNGLTVIKQAGVTSTGDETEILPAVYPTVVNELLFVDLAGFGNGYYCTLELFGFGGKSLYKQQLPAGANQVSLNLKKLGLKPGPYLVNIQSSRKTASCKIILK